MHFAFLFVNTQKLFYHSKVISQYKEYIHPLEGINFPYSDFHCLVFLFGLRLGQDNLTNFNTKKSPIKAFERVSILNLLRLRFEGIIIWWRGLNTC